MTMNELRTHLEARARQAIAESGLDINTVDKATVETLVQNLADGALLELDKHVQNSLKPAALAAVVGKGGHDPFDPDPLREDVLWEGRPLLSINTRYLITDERIRITEGILGKKREDIELVRIQDVSQSQNVGERLLSIGDITIRSNDRGNPIIVLQNIADPEKVHEIVRRAVLNARKKHGFTYREEM